MNLLRNAAKFTTEGSITLGYEVDSENETISFVVTDTGVGIPEGKERKIFERFEQVDNKGQGNGLGLSVCALIARLLKGDIYADPNVERGARFVFTIPYRT